MSKNYCLQLTEKIKDIADGNGGFIEGEVLEVAAPSMQNYNHIAILKGFVGQAMKSMSDMNTATSESSSNNDTMDAATARLMLQMGNVYAQASEEFIKFLSKNSKIDDIKVNESVIRRIEVKDFEKCLGEYFATFLFEM